MSEIAFLPLPRRRLAPLAAVVLGTLAFPSMALAAVPTAGFASWFRVDETRTARWWVEPVEGDPLQVLVRRIDGATGPLRRILALYPRPSPAYDVAISKTLEVFAAKDLNAEILAFNFQRDDGRGATALQMVDDGSFDLIMAMGSESTAWLHQYYRNGAVPVVTICAKDPVALSQIANYDEGS